MQTSFSVRNILFLALCTSAAFLSCEKSSNSSSPSSNKTAITPAQQTALMNVTNTEVESSSTQDENISDALNVPAPDGGTEGGAQTCRVVTYNPTSKTYPYVATINFGTGCLGPDGITRRGEKIVTYFVNPDSAAAGAEVTLTTYNNYYEDSSKIDGNIKIYVKQTAAAGQLILQYVTDQLFTSSNGSVMASSGVHYWAQIAGGSTISSKDNVFSITGSAKGFEILNGATLLTFTSTVDASNPVIKPVSCYFRTQGVVNIAIDVLTGGNANFAEVLNYGSGACDNIATLSINGGTPQQVTLPLMYWPLSL